VHDAAGRPCGEEQRKRGVVAASAGNHALALAYHGGALLLETRVESAWCQRLKLAYD